MRRMLFIIGILACLLSMPAVIAMQTVEKTSSIPSPEKTLTPPSVPDYDGTFLGGLGEIYKDENDEWQFDTQAYIAGVYKSGRRLRVFSNIYNLDEEKIGKLFQGASAFHSPRMICSSEKDFYGKQGGNGLVPSLLYHLDIIHIEIPPLRERKSEILFMANVFLREYKIKYGKNISGFSLSVRRMLFDYDWPGNVSELRRVVEEAIILTQGRIVEDIFFM